MRELGLHGLCVSSRFAPASNRCVKPLLGAGQLCLIALFQVLELGWAFLRGQDWLPPNLAGVSSDVKAAVKARPSSRTPQTQPECTNHTSLHTPVI